MSNANDEAGARHAAVKEKLAEEFKLYWIITLYLAVLFGLLMIYRRLLLAEAGVTYLGYGFALIEALVIAKVILIGDALGLSRRFADRALVIPVLYRTLLFGLFVMLFGAVEHVVEGLFHKKTAGDILQGIADIGLYEILARVLMLIVAFVPFFAFWELARVLGPHKLSALFFSSRREPAIQGGHGSGP